MKTQRTLLECLNKCISNLKIRLLLYWISLSTNTFLAIVPRMDKLASSAPGTMLIMIVMLCITWCNSQAIAHFVRFCIKSITNFPIPGTRKKGKPRKTWSECVKTDVNECGLAGIDTLDRDAWRADVWHSLVLPTPFNGFADSTLIWIWRWMDGWIRKKMLSYPSIFCYEIEKTIGRYLHRPTKDPIFRNYDCVCKRNLPLSC